MELPVTIGKCSDNNLLQVDLRELPHLFISYSEPVHLQQCFRDLVTGLAVYPVQFYLSLNRANFHFLHPLLPAGAIKQVLVNLEPELSTVKGKGLFLRSLMNQMAKRKKQAAGDYPPLLVLADDIFDLIITKRKYTGESFLQLLKEGHLYGIYFVVATIRTYRNLMSQLQQEGNRCAELIINPEYFFFFKTRDEISYTCYYPVKEEGVSV